MIILKLKNCRPIVGPYRPNTLSASYNLYLFALINNLFALDHLGLYTYFCNSMLISFSKLLFEFSPLAAKDCIDLNSVGGVIILNNYFILLK